jgi:hypothetical protein
VAVSLGPARAAPGPAGEQIAFLPVRERIVHLRDLKAGSVKLPPSQARLLVVAPPQVKLLARRQGGVFDPRTWFGWGTKPHITTAEAWSGWRKELQTLYRLGRDQALPAARARDRLYVLLPGTYRIASSGKKLRVTEASATQRERFIERRAVRIPASALETR